MDFNMKKHASHGAVYWVFLLLLGVSFSVTSADDGFKCPEQFGYYPDMDDCTKYYVCVFGDSLHEKCTGGLFFSVELQTCDWPRNVECANGVKPGGAVVAPEDLAADDEIFSSSRRTSATASGDSNRVQRPVAPNPDTVSNYQIYDEQETREYPRNAASRSQDRQQNLRLSTKTPSPTVPPQTLSQSTTQSSAHQNRHTTTVNDNAPIPSTVSEDPLYASDDQSKVSSPLDNYDPQQPEYDEAVPPIVDSNGNIHVADNGHGFDAFAGFAHLPGLGDYSSVFAKPISNSGNPGEGESEEDRDYKSKDQRNRNSQTNSQSTRPRSLESGSNNGHSKDPDVVIDYTSNSKGINDFNIPSRERVFATPSPVIFDDSEDHRDYGRFDVITPVRSSSPREKETLLDLVNRNPQSPVRSSNIHKDSGMSLDSRKHPSSGQHTNPEDANGEKSSGFFPMSDQQDYRRLNQNGQIVQSVPYSSNSPSDNKAINDKHVADRNSNYDASAGYRIAPERTLNAEYGILELSGHRSQEKDLRINPNANVDFDTIVSSNNGNNQDVNTRFTQLNKPNHGFAKEYSTSENSNGRNGNKDSGSEVLHRDVSITQNDRDQANENSREVRQREHKPSQNKPDITHTLPAIIIPTKDLDSPYIDVPSGEDFGIYTGQRQGRKQDDNRETIQTQGIKPQKSGDNAPSQQPNKLRQPTAKDYPHVILDTSVREDAHDQTYNEGYGDLQRGYGEYDSPKPHFTEDYYTNEDPETSTQTTTTTTTARPLRTRPTRPRRTTTPPTTTTTTSTTPAPIRIRTRRPLTQVTRAPNKPLFVATTPASPPYRPSPLYPTPVPMSSAQKCDPRKCKLPDCRCGGTDIPGEFQPQEIPQIVLLTFDDAVNDLNHDLYDELFNSGRANPNGCPILGTFYVSHEWTDYGQVQTLYSHGHEIASHSITHSYGEKFSKNQWLREIHGQREILHLYGGVKMEDIRGMRAPFLQIGGNKMFEMLYDANFTYDSSMPVYENDPPFWPYTLDYALGHECMIFPCPTKSYPGLWEVGMIMWVDLRGGRCSMGDACSNPGDEESVVKMLMKNFNRHYKSNRAPFGLFYHSAWFNTQHHRRGFMKFIDEILKNDDVWLVTNWQAIEWIRNPTPSAKMKDFEPFDCRKVDRPPPCPSPTVCNVWYQGGVRYMKTCQPCPAKYPWVGNTGYDSNSRG